MNPNAKKIVRIGIPLGDHYAMGPGKADLLEAIGETGSISAAGRRLGMSYRRAWLLVDEMNKCFREPLVQARLGGAKGGGAEVTPLGQEALKRYRALQVQAWDAVRHSLKEYGRLLGLPPAEPPRKTRAED
ncbi:MAG TPA: winged helix-turn-helix domain-containing protein [Holophaga sp.]|nr:winged helix-turn-helix domain-containing protein [Holophaga sp.]